MFGHFDPGFDNRFGHRCYCLIAGVDILYQFVVITREIESTIYI